MGTALVVFFRRVLNSVQVLATHFDTWVTHCVHVPGDRERRCAFAHPNTLKRSLSCVSRARFIWRGAITNRQWKFRPTPRTLDTTVDRGVFQDDRFTTVLLTQGDGNESLSGIGGLLILVSGDDDTCDRGVNRPHTLGNPRVRRAIWGMTDILLTNKWNGHFSMPLRLRLRPPQCSIVDSSKVAV